MRWRDLRRLFHVARVAAAHRLMHRWGRRSGPILRFLRRLRIARYLPAAELSGPERLRTTLEDLGGMFIKLGQMLAVQPDILSLEHCYALFKLLDRVEPFPYSEVERVVRDDLGRGPEEVFDRFERRPFASASIGQVHRAWLGERALAIKVQRPSVERDFAVDLRLMNGAIRMIRALRLRSLDWLVEPLTEFVSWTRDELDYTREARYLSQLRDNAADNPREEVPGVLLELTTSRVLVMDFLDGVPVIDYLRGLEAGDGAGEGEGDRDGDGAAASDPRLAGFDRDAYARAIIDNFLGDAFRHGLFHADLHPANLLIRPGNVVGYIDFGITGLLSRYARRHLVAMTVAYTRGDLEGMSSAFFKVSVMERNADPAAFRRGLRRLARGWYDRRGREIRLRKSFTMMMLDMLRLSRATGVWPERDVIKYVRSAIIIDGLVNRFAPGFDVGRYLERVCTRRLMEESLRDAFSPERLIEWAATVAELARDGPARLSVLSGRALDGELAVRADVRSEAESASGAAGASGLRDRALGQTAFVAGTGLLAALAAGRPELGWNVFTVTVLLLAAGLTGLLDTLRRLA